MTERRWSDADRELVAQILASRVRYSQHSQVCPVWVNRPTGVRVGDGRAPSQAELTRCDCWGVSHSRTDAAAVLDALTAAGWRPPPRTVFDEIDATVAALKARRTGGTDE